MKNSILLCSALLFTTTLYGQRPSMVSGTRAVGHSHLTGNRAVTDTLAPGSWAQDPETQLTLWGALCGEVGAEIPCGFILGTNGYGDKAKAQQFLLDANPTTLIEGIIFWFYAKGGNPDGVVHARLYAINGNGTTSSGTITGGAPGTVLASKDFTLADVDTTAEDGFTPVYFDSPVYVNTQFAIGFDVSSLGANDSLGLIGTSGGTTDFPEFSWEKWSNNSWHTLVEAWGDDLNVDLCVFAMVDNSSVGIGEPGSFNHMRMSFLNGNIAAGTVQLGYELEQPGRMELVVHDATGKVMYERALGHLGAGGYQHAFGTDSWAAGHYFVTLKHNGQPLTKRLTVQ